MPAADDGGEGCSLVGGALGPVDRAVCPSCITVGETLP